MIVISATLLVWFFALPVHSLSLKVSGESAALARVKVTVKGEAKPRVSESDSQGLIRVGSLWAADGQLTLSGEGYHPETRAYAFGNVLWPGEPISVTLSRAYGVLSIDSNFKGASVEVDGQPQDRMTPAQLTLSVGPHTVRLARAGCQPSASLPIKVTEDQTVPETLDLNCPPAPKLYTLEVWRSPDAATITIDRVEQDGGTPILTIRGLSAGQHTVIARLDGVEKTREIRFPPGGQRITFDFSHNP